MKRSRKNIFFGVTVAFLIALFALAGYAHISSSAVVPILMYHSFQVEEDTLIPYVSPEVFDLQMEFLAKNRYNVITPDKVIAYMTGKEKMPPKTVLITADDGYYNFYEIAYPILKKYKLPATFFIATNNIGRPGYLGWKELKEMSDSGLITIGSHTKSHPWLPTISVDENKLRDELAGSRKVLESGLGKRVDYLCYPNGGFNDATEEATRKAGYLGAFTTNHSRKSPGDDIYAIRRIKMSNSSVNPVILWGKISRYYAWFKERR